MFSLQEQRERELERAGEGQFYKRVCL